MKMRRLDHIVLYVNDMEASRRFYHEVFDMPILENQSTDKCVTLRCGHQLIRLRQAGSQEGLVVKKPEAGTADFCMVARDKMEDIIRHFKSYEVPVVKGPVTKHGSEGEMQSIYVSDPDHNLLEVAVYANK